MELYRERQRPLTGSSKKDERIFIYKNLRHTVHAPELLTLFSYST